MTSTADSIGHKVSISLPCLNAYTGCVTVSVCTSKRKLTTLKAYKANEQYKNLFAGLDANIDVSEELVHKCSHVIYMKEKVLLM